MDLYLSLDPSKRRKSVNRVDSTEDNSHLEQIGIDPSLVKGDKSAIIDLDNRTLKILQHSEEWHKNQPIIGKDW